MLMDTCVQNTGRVPERKPMQFSTPTTVVFYVAAVLNLIFFYFPLFFADPKKSKEPSFLVVLPLGILDGVAILMCLVETATKFSR